MFCYLLLFLSLSLGLLARPLKVEVSAPAALLINADTGAILYEKESHARYFPASITKIATALYVLEKYGHRLDEIVTISSQAISTVPSYQRQLADAKHPPFRLEVGGSNMALLPGERLSVRTLLYGLLLSSGNDAANVLAETVSGSIDLFMEELNLFLQSHGVLETHFVNPHGLHHNDHWTTAADMAKVTQLAMKHSVFREMVKSTKYVRPQTNKQPANYLVQTNRLLKQGSYFYPKAIGVKTGYTSHAGYTLVGAATHEGRTLIAVLLNCAESHQRFRDAIKLYDAAFAQSLVSRVLFAKGADRFSHQLSGAASTIKAVLKDDFVIDYYPAEEPTFRAEIHWRVGALPISKEAEVGFLQLVTPEGVVLKQQPIFAMEAVGKRWWVYLKEHKGLFLGLFLVAQVALLLLYFFKKSQKVQEG